MKAIWKNQVLAESDETRVVEGNHYFPPGSMRQEFFEASETETHCPWKGQASYKTIVVDGERNLDAAWIYPNAKPAAAEIEGYTAFWRGVVIE